MPSVEPCQAFWRLFGSVLVAMFAIFESDLLAGLSLTRSGTAQAAEGQQVCSESAARPDQACSGSTDR